jgi:hypothetical protein
MEPMATRRLGDDPSRILRKNSSHTNQDSGEDMRLTTAPREYGPRHEQRRAFDSMAVAVAMQPRWS